MFKPDLRLETAIKFSHFDTSHLLSPASPHPIVLEDENWQTAEHYVQAQLAGSAGAVERIRKMTSARQAFDFNKPWYRRKKTGWKNQRRLFMTRALYTKVQMYEEVRDYLLSTGDDYIAETSQYDHYWGIGRDQRGENMLGKVWLDIRARLLTNQA